MARTDRPLGVPAGWNDVIVRTLQMGILAFFVLVMKEYMDTKEWDFKACAGDSAWIAGGVLVFNIILMLMVPKERR